MLARVQQIVVTITLTLIAACATAPATPAPLFELIDLTDDYSALYARTMAFDSTERVRAFEDEIAPLFPEFYGRARFPETTAERYDARIARSFERFAEIQAPYHQVAASFRGSLEPALTSFVSVMPDLAPIGEVYLLHSLGEMDGGTRAFNGHTYLIFGADVIARVHPQGSEQPFLHHELFHVYHRQNVHEKCETVWCALWWEGAAVLAAHELNPEASDAQLLLTQPEPIRAAVDEHLAEAICAVQARLDSRDDADYGALFSNRRLSETLPPRFGYYVGYLVAREARRSPRLCRPWKLRWLH